MKKHYSIVILSRNSWQILCELNNTFKEKDVKLESMEINSAIGDMAWIELNCSIVSDSKESLRKHLMSIIGVSEVEITERCSNTTLNRKESILEMKIAS